MVPAEGFEPPTPGSEDQCSNPLSYAGMIMNCDIITDLEVFLNQLEPSVDDFAPEDVLSEIPELVESLFLLYGR